MTVQVRNAEMIKMIRSELAYGMGGEGFVGASGNNIAFSSYSPYVWGAFEERQDLTPPLNYSTYFNSTIYKDFNILKVVWYYSIWTATGEPQDSTHYWSVTIRRQDTDADIPDLVLDTSSYPMPVWPTLLWLRTEITLATPVSITTGMGGIFVYYARVGVSDTHIGLYPPVLICGTIT